MVEKDNILKLKTRKELYEFIKDNPGLNLRDISRKKEIPVSTLNYHLFHMEKLEIIEIKSKGQYKFLYAKHKVGTHDKQIIQLLRQKIPCQIFLSLLFSAAFSQKDICEDLDLNPPLVNYHIKKLIKLGIIEEIQIKERKFHPLKNHPEPLLKRVFHERRPIGREKIYVGRNRDIIEDFYRVLITHKESFENKEYIQSFIDLWEELESYLNYLKVNKKEYLKPQNKHVVCDIILELIKPPFAY